MSLESFSSLVYCLLVKLDPTLLNSLSGPLIEGRLLAMPTIIRIGWKCFPGTNTQNSKITDKKFYKIGPRGQCCKAFLIRDLRIFVLSLSVC
jgi:hypothetical protein